MPKFTITYAITLFLFLFSSGLYAQKENGNGNLGTSARINTLVFKKEFAKNTTATIADKQTFFTRVTTENNFKLSAPYN